MKWRFWLKDKNEGAQIDESKYIPFEIGKTRNVLPKPRDLPPVVGRHLVVVLNKDPDWVWNLKAILYPKEDQKYAFRIRIFDPGTAKAKGVAVHNYTSLNDHRHLILFEGWFRKNSEDIVIEEVGHEKVA